MAAVIHHCRDKCECDNELLTRSRVSCASPVNSFTVSVLAIQAKKKRKNPKGRKGKGGDGDNTAAAAAGGNMTSSRSGDVGPNAASGRQFR